MDVARVTKDKTIALPDGYDSLLDGQPEFLVSQSGDTLLLKKLQRPIWEIAASMPDPNQPTMEEICNEVREVRREMKLKRSSFEKNI